MGQLMALIECHECGIEVSNLAHSCPGCGAPIGDDARQLDTTKSEQCGLCRTPVDPDASVCPNCQARKGYLNVIWPLEIGVVGKVGISVVIGLFLILFLRSLTLFVIELLLISMFALAYLFYKYKKGPMWYQSRNPRT